MSQYEVTFEFTMEQIGLVEATSKAEAIAKAKDGDWEAIDCNRTPAPHRKFTATRIGDDE